MSSRIEKVEAENERLRRAAAKEAREMLRMLETVRLLNEKVAQIADRVERDFVGPPPRPDLSLVKGADDAR